MLTPCNLPLKPLTFAPTTMPACVPPELEAKTTWSTCRLIRSSCSASSILPGRSRSHRRHSNRQPELRMAYCPVFEVHLESRPVWLRVQNVEPNECVRRVIHRAANCHSATRVSCRSVTARSANPLSLLPLRFDDSDLIVSRPL